MTPKQERFCCAYVETGNAVEAMRKAGYTYKNPKTAAEAASRMLKSSKIAARIAEIKAPAVEKAGLTLESHLETLKDLRDEALSAGKFGPAVQAEIARGKVSGFYVEKVEVEANVKGSVSYRANMPERRT